MVFSNPLCYYVNGAWLVFNISALGKKIFSIELVIFFYVIKIKSVVLFCGWCSNTYLFFSIRCKPLLGKENEDRQQMIRNGRDEFNQQIHQEAVIL